MAKSPLHVCVIGSGISGLGCCWVLSQYPKSFHVSLFEKNDYLGNILLEMTFCVFESLLSGGHSNTVKVPNDKGETCFVDTGFIVYNELNYPNLVKLFEMLNVETMESDMSFALSVKTQKDKELEWGSDGLPTVFSQKSNLFSWRFWRMLYEILYFGHHCASDLHNRKQYAQMTLGEYLKKECYSQEFIDHYLLPITSSVWSIPSGQALDFPLYTLIHFLYNHQNYRIFNRPCWRTVVHGCHQYVNKIREALEISKADIKLNTAIVGIQRKKATDGSIRIYAEDSNGHRHEFDRVIFACHADQALQILGKEATSEENQLLGCFRYAKNKAYLHNEESLMPIRRNAWSSWNYLRRPLPEPCPTNVPATTTDLVLTYWMNRLQPFLSGKFPLFVTLNPPIPPPANKTFATFDYEHPIYLAQASQCPVLSIRLLSTPQF